MANQPTYVLLGLAHLIEVASVIQACMCFTYHNTCERLLCKNLQPSLSEQRISLRAALTSKQRRAVYIHVLRKTGRGGEHHLTLRTSKIPLSPSLLNCGWSCTVQIVQGGGEYIKERRGSVRQASCSPFWAMKMLTLFSKSHYVFYSKIDNFKSLFSSWKKSRCTRHRIWVHSSATGLGAFYKVFVLLLDSRTIC